MHTFKNVTFIFMVLHSFSLFSQAPVELPAVSGEPVELQSAASKANVESIPNEQDRRMYLYLRHNNVKFDPTSGKDPVEQFLGLCREDNYFCFPQSVPLKHLPSDLVSARGYSRGQSDEIFDYFLGSSRSKFNNLNRLGPVEPGEACDSPLLVDQFECALCKEEEVVYRLGALGDWRCKDRSLLRIESESVLVADRNGHFQKCEAGGTGCHEISWQEAVDFEVSRDKKGFLYDRNQVANDILSRGLVASSQEVLDYLSLRYPEESKD